MKGEINEFGLKEFARGETVRIRMTPDIVGQVIGQRDWGERYLIRLGGSTEAHWFEDVELETYIAAQEVTGGHDEEPQKGNSRVVNLDAARAARMGRVH